MEPSCRRSAPATRGARRTARAAPAWCLAETGRDVVVFDKLTYAGNRAFLEGVSHSFVHGDVCDEDAVRRVMNGVDAVVPLDKA